MSIPNTGSSPQENESPDDLVRVIEIDGPSEPIEGPAHLAVQKLLETDRENIERFLAWGKRQQEKLDARCRAERKPGNP